MNEHHPSCTPNDRNLMWVCAKCGKHESAEHILTECDQLRDSWEVMERDFNEYVSEIPQVRMLRAKCAELRAKCSELTAKLDMGEQHYAKFKAQWGDELTAKLSKEITDQIARALHYPNK